MPVIFLLLPALLLGGFSGQPLWAATGTLSHRDPPECLILRFSPETRSAGPVALAGAQNEHLFIRLELEGASSPLKVRLEGAPQLPALPWRVFRLAAAPPSSPPDALLPLEEAGGDEGPGPRDLWLALKIPADFPRGVHALLLKISDGRGLLEVPVQLRVYGFRLPEDLPLAVCGGLWHQGAPGPLREVRVIKAYYRSLREYKINVLGGAYPVPLDRVGEGLPPEDLGPFQELAAYALNDLKFRAIQLPGPKEWRRGAGAETPWGREARRWYPRIAAYLERQGWGGRALAYVADEPRPEDHGAVYQAYALVKSLAPGVRTLSAGWRPAREFSRVIDIWAFQAGHYREEEVSAARQAGQEVWLYANRFHTHGRPLAHPRFIGWLLYRYGFAGYLLWGVNYWPRDPWTTPPGPHDFFRRGTFYYPHPRTGLPVPTTRLEALRRGFQDYQYLKMLEQAVQQGRVPEARYAAIRERVARLTDNLPGTPGPPDMQEMEALRLEIGTLLDETTRHR